MQETAINWDSESKEIVVSTSESHIKNKLDKLCKDFKNHYVLKSESGEYKNYIIKSKKLVRFCKPVILSEKEKEKLKERFKK